MEYAGFWRRFIAMIIDAIVAGLLAFAICLLITFVRTIKDGVMPFDPIGDAYDLSLGGIGILVWFVYYIAFEGSRAQATPGKMAVGITVTGTEGGPIGVGRAFARNFSRFLSGLIFYIGFLMAAFTSRKQALHDITAGCLVVKR